jgi:hypothetical protein
MTRIDTRLTPAEAARWWRDQVLRDHLAPTSSAEAAYMHGAKACSVDHGNGNVGERKRSRFHDGRDDEAGEYYHQGTLRLAQ